MSHLLPQHQYVQVNNHTGRPFLLASVLLVIGSFGAPELFHTIACLALAYIGYRRVIDQVRLFSPWFMATVCLVVSLFCMPSDGNIYGILAAWPIAWEFVAAGLTRLIRNNRGTKVVGPPSSATLLDREPRQQVGAVAGTFGNEMVVSSPRGATLVIGPPGKGKTTCVIMPTVAAASHATVSASVKWEVFYETCETRAKKGALWALDLGSGVPEGAQRILWSPLTDVTGWDSAVTVARDWAKPYAQTANDTHWIDSASDWLSVILFAARNADVATFSKWCRTANVQEIEDEILLYETEGDIGSRLAIETLNGLAGAPDNERGSILSTLRRITAVYNSETVLAQNGVDFDPHTFVHTADTVYIAASTKEQYASAGLVSALLGSIASAQMKAHNNQRTSGVVTMVIDEVANVARPPLDEWASQFGGQGIALTAALQDLSQARKAWPGINMLGLFPTVILMPGIRDDETLETFSNIAGQFDRTIVTTGSGTSESQTAFAIPTRTTSENVSVQTQRESIVPREAIAQMPVGEGMFWTGASWWYIKTTPWSDPYWNDYREAVPAQWRAPVEEDTPPMLLEANADDGDVILYKAQVIQDRAEGKLPQDDIENNQWGRR